MPELPEVETIVRDLSKKVNGARIQNVKIFDGRVVRQASEKEFCSRLNGQTIQKVSRRGKAILFHIVPSQDVLVIQLGMTGQVIGPTLTGPESSTKITFQLSNRFALHYNDYRTFGRLQVVNDLAEIPYFQTIGPEPLEGDFTISWLAGQLHRRKTPIKPLLLNHEFLAGIGNIYASEILFDSGIHPRRPAASLNKDEVALLYRATKKILREAIRLRGTSMNTYRDTNGQKGHFIDRIKVYGRENESCLLCACALVREFQSGRSTFYCPRCQK